MSKFTEYERRFTVLPVILTYHNENAILHQNKRGDMLMKRRLLAALVLSIVMLMTVACGSKNKAEPETTPVSITAEAKTVTEIEESKETAGSSSGRAAMESFAEQIQEAAADKNLEALADLAVYPVSVKLPSGEQFIVETREDFLKMDVESLFQDEFLAAVASVDTAVLEPVNSDIIMGDGTFNIVFEQAEDGSYGITGINQIP